MTIIIEQFTASGGDNLVAKLDGSAGSDAVTYSIAGVAGGQSVSTAKFQELANVVNSERVRRRGSASYVDLNAMVGRIDASDLNAMVNALHTAPYPYTPGFAGVGAGGIIYASHVNDMINKVVAAGAVCLCNCNYCTCNCNWSCPCNCNYSDKRLKENIEYIETKEGLNIYSWNYVWDKATRYVGVMAQELLSSAYASAVKTDKNGYYMVDYARLPI